MYAVFMVFNESKDVYFKNKTYFPFPLVTWLNYFLYSCIPLNRFTSRDKTKPDKIEFITV